MDERNFLEKFNDLLNSDDDKSLATFIALGFVTLSIICSVIAGVYMMITV